MKFDRSKMKIHINKLEDSRNVAPVIFAKRLAEGLERQGAEIVGRDQKHDILLAFIRDQQMDESKKKGAKIVQRLDGIYHNFEQDFKERNKSIQETYEKVDATIFQSEFNKNMVQYYFGKNDAKNFIIHNGVDPEKFAKNKTYQNEKNIFLCSAKWRPNKRLESIVDGFLKADMPKSELWVLGEPDYVKSEDRIKYFGEVNHKQLPEFYNNADFLAHFCKNDSCPNSVVEGLVAGLPVIGPSSGGTKELVNGSGEIIKENESLEPYYLSQIEQLDKEKVAESFHKVVDKRNEYDFPRTDLYMENCAKNYMEAFEKTLQS